MVVQPGLVGNPKDRFCCDTAHYYFYYYRKLDDGGSSGPSAGGSKLGRHSTTYKNLILKLTQMLKEEINMVGSFLYQCAVICEPCHEKNCHRVSDQARRKLGCTTTEDD